ncbi:hypothetical protein DXG01_008611 [Tephrocybe rancida]|nr:hypothetical protein DXG01_008611 [Tephrocybe rancida]
MAPPPWTTPDQGAFLNRHIDSFLEHQKASNLNTFAIGVEKSWFAQWPLKNPPPIDLSDQDACKKHNDELALMRKRLGEWFRNHTRELKKQSAGLDTLMKPAKSKRALQAVEIYSKQFYSEKVQPQVHSTVSIENVKATGTLNVIKNQTREAFASETPEVRAAVFALRDASKEAAKTTRNQEPEARTPSQYAEAIANASTLIEHFSEQMGHHTGWVWSVMGGGPDPVNGGRIRTMAYHFGENYLGHSFKKNHQGYVAAVQDPYSDFVRSAYSDSVCASRALSASMSSTPVKLSTKGLITMPSKEDNFDMSNIDPVLHHTPTSTPTSNPTFTPTTSVAPFANFTTSTQSVQGHGELDAPSSAPTPLPVPNTFVLPPVPVPSAISTSLSSSTFPFTPVTRNDGAPFVFPTGVYEPLPCLDGENADDQSSHVASLTSSPIRLPSPTHSADLEHWNELVNGLNKRPDAPTAPPATKAVSKKTVRQRAETAPTTETVPTSSTAAKPSRPKARPKKKAVPAVPTEAAQPSPPATGVQPAEAEPMQSGRTQRIRKGAATKEVIPLTVDADGALVRDAYGNPIDANAPATKRKRGKENSNVSTKKAKKV